MPTVFDELRTMLGLPADMEPFALGAACLGEIKKLRNAQNVHTAEIKAWRAENRQLRDKNQELRDKTQELRDENRELRNSPTDEVFPLKFQRIAYAQAFGCAPDTSLVSLLDAAVKRVMELDRTVGDARSATGQLYDLYRRVQTRLIDLVRLRDLNIRTIELLGAENDALSADLGRANAEIFSLHIRVSSHEFEIARQRRRLDRQQSRCDKYKNRVRHHLRAREAKIGRMRKRLEQPPTSAEGAHHERELLAWLSEKDQAAERLMRIISERNQEIRDLKFVVATRDGQVARLVNTAEADRRERLRVSQETARPKRQVVQMIDWGDNLTVLCTDGTIWYRLMSHPHTWVEVDPPPTA